MDATGATAPRACYPSSMRTLQWSAIGVIVLSILASYSVALLRDGAWPTGHPWSVIAMTCIAVSLGSTVRRPERPPMIVPVSILAVIASILWLRAALFG